MTTTRKAPDAEAPGAGLRRVGRTRLGEEPRGASPTVRARLADADFTAFKQLQERTGSTESELVRTAVKLLLANYGAKGSAS